MPRNVHGESLLQACVTPSVLGQMEPSPSTGLGGREELSCGLLLTHSDRSTAHQNTVKTAQPAQALGVHLRVISGERECPSQGIQAGAGRSRACGKHVSEGDRRGSGGGVKWS